MVLNPNCSYLNFYESLEHVSDAHGHVFNDLPNVISRVDQLPNFSICLDRSISIIDVELEAQSTKTKTSIFAEIANTFNGLHKIDYSSTNLGYDIWRYAGKIIGSVQVGEYRLIVSLSNSNKLYSDLITCYDYINDKIILTYRHSEPIIVPSGHINYSLPYINYIYLNTRFGKPEFVYDQVIRENLGRKYVRSLTSYVRVKASVLLTEAQCLALRIVPLHDYIIFTQNGISIKAEHVELQIEALSEGDLFECVFVVDYDSAVFTNAKGKTVAGDYDPDAYNEDYLIQ